ncbi:MAG: efflux RND transporter periplasmic adaptor subunit [Chromatiaceae bacterium]|nr:efflux RND transporter periplasmic adaptor subunit [Chromatiaceae bacterium]
MNPFPRARSHPSPADVRQAPRTGAPGFSHVLLIPVLLGLAACGDQQQAGVTAAPPAPAVVAVPAVTRPVEDQAQFVGRVVAVDKVELRARVQGFLKERTFTEGQQVQVGDKLFQIEPEQFESVVQQRQADLAKAVAEAENADSQLASGQELLKNKNIARLKVDELKAAAAVAHASIAQAKAAVAAAELNLGYTTMLAPIAGRIGLSQYTVGNLVGPSSNPLATIVSHDPIYVQFPLTQRQLLEARRDIKAKGADVKDVVVRASLSDGSLYDQPGRINFVDVTTDAGTDTVTLRAELPNPDGVLVDGQYVRITVQAGEPQAAIVIPQSALQVDQQGVFVLVVDAEQKARVRRVQMGANLGADAVVNSGLEEGALVITDGIQKVRPGQSVTATPAQTAETVQGSGGK